MSRRRAGATEIVHADRASLRDDLASCAESVISPDIDT